MKINFDLTDEQKEKNYRLVCSCWDKDEVFTMHEIAWNFYHEDPITDEDIHGENLITCMRNWDSDWGEKELVSGKEISTNKFNTETYYDNGKYLLVDTFGYISLYEIQ